MNRRSFIEMLAAGIAAIFATPKLLYGKPKGYRTYIAGKDTFIASGTWVKYKFHCTTTLPPDRTRVRKVTNISMQEAVANGFENTRLIQR